MTVNEDLKHWLRHALRHLYNPSALEISPLVRAFGASNCDAPASALRRIITETIRSLEPGAEIPDNADIWCFYEILMLRYVQQCPQLEVSEQLGLSSRHLRRREQQAIDYLAQSLQKRVVGNPEHSGVTSGQSMDSVTLPSFDEELTWLKESATSESANLTQALSFALQIVRPMANGRCIELDIVPPPDLPPIQAPQVGLHQMIVSLLSTAIRWTSHGRVSLYAELADRCVVVRLEISPVDPELANSQENEQSLSVARQLISACRGKIEAEREGTAFVLAITLPIVKQFTILVFDDNEDVLDLLQRYTSGTRFRIHGAHDVEQALISAEKCKPQAILLDVMMPRIGGWEALGRLRNHPLTQHIPVIICTILPERELALSLGASGFIHKPFTRMEFLAALDREIGQAAQERD